VVSHPREFRKPNYLMALATGELLFYTILFIVYAAFTHQVIHFLYAVSGVTLVHFQWIVDCKDNNKRLSVEQYLLPSGCCALHAYNIFSSPRNDNVSVPSKGGAGLLGPAVEPEGRWTASRC